MKKNILFILVPAIVLIPFVYLCATYGSLPPQVPTHFSLDGKPDSYSNKTAFLSIILLLLAINVGMYLLLTNIHKIDPKKAADQSKKTMQKIAFAIVVLLSGMTVMMIYSAAKNGFSFNKIMLPMFGLFFAYLGNLLYSVKPNYFVGIRTPWALEDEDTWRKTHQLAGKLWFVGGILITIVTLITPAKPAFIIMTSIIVIITFIPGIYSYRYFQLHKS